MDLNGDGFLDAVAYGWSIAGDTAEIWLNDGLGNFSHHPINPLIGYGVTADLAPGDFDGDGDVEFITLAAFIGDPDYIWLNQNASE
jgi:hypothetical protein